MILDAQNLFSDDQAVTATAASTNVIDLGADRDIGKGAPVRILCQVTEDFATLTSLVAALQTDTVENFASPTTLKQSAAVAAADLKAGYQFALDYMPNANERYLRLYYTVAGDNATAGKITAGLVLDVQSNG